MINRGIIKITAFLFIFCIIFGFKSVFAGSNDEYNIIINDARLNNEVKAIETEGLICVPLDKIKADLGIEIVFDKDYVKITRADQTLNLKLQQDKAYLELNDGAQRYYVTIKNGNVYIPVLLLVDYLGLKVEILNEIKCIRIISKPGFLPARELINKYLEAGAAVGKPPAAVNNKNGESKIAYLTFDDGLDSKVTPQILDILKRYNVKAAFFIIGNTISKNKDVLKKIVKEGHAVGNHTYTHKKSIIYSNAESLLAEIKKAAQ